MQDDLELPNLLTGPWEHALFLSFGLDLPFFERALASQLPSSCRNRILLGDERTYLASCEHYAASGLVQHANRRYVAEPILRRAPSHAKVVLLTAPDAGRMLVGSGNVSLQGYGSGGELFTIYEHGGATTAHRAEFVAMRRLLERMRDDGLLTRTAAWHVDQLLAGSSWLFQDANGSQLRHNLDHSFSQQLADEVAGEPVDELWVLAPFFDPAATALRTLQRQLKPQRTVLLVQPGRTSLDPAVVESLQGQLGAALEVRAVERVVDPDAWIHAKLFLVRLGNAAICLQGSANASVAALERPQPAGNLEVMNLLRGPPHAFDAIFDGLTIGKPVADIGALDLKAPEIDDDDLLAQTGWQLTGAEWTDGILRITYRGGLPSSQALQVMIDRNLLGGEILSSTPGALDLRVLLDSGETVTTGSPIRLVLADGVRSNAIFPCDRAALEATLRSVGAGDEKLVRLGHLDLDDEELEQLLHELESALVIDQRSLWQLSGRSEPAPATESQDELQLAYSDVDYEMLRAHPKLRQYLHPGGPGAGPRSRLQIILNSITRAFTDLLEPDDELALAAATAALAGGDEAATATVDDGEDEEAPRMHWSAQARINVLLRNFIKRFLMGLSSPNFQEIVGARVVAQNYIVFLHFLARLGDRHWIDQEFMLDAITRTVQLFWGDSTHEGCFSRCNEAERKEVLELIRETHSDAQLLAVVYQYAVESRLQGLEESRLRTRDTWTGLLERANFTVTAAALMESQAMLRGFSPPYGPSVGQIADELLVLAEFLTRHELASRVGERLQVRRATCWFTRENVRLRGHELVVDCLTIQDDNAELSVDDARWILALWLQVEALPHYRVALRRSHGVKSHTVAFYEPQARRGKYAVLDLPSGSVDLTALRQPPSPWDDSMLEVLAAAEAAESPPTPPLRSMKNN